MRSSHRRRPVASALPLLVALALPLRAQQVPGDSLLSAFLTAVREESPLLAAARAEVAAAEGARRAAGPSPAPTLSAAIEEVPDGVDLPNAGMLRVDLQRPFFTGRVRGADRASAGVRVELAAARLALLERGLRASVERDLRRWRGWRAIAARLAAEDTLLLDAEAALRARFTAGEARYVDVLRIRTERLRVQTDRAAALRSGQVGRRRLEALSPAAGPARATLDEYNQPAVGFTLNNGGVAKFSAVTSANVGRILAIILDNRVVSTPQIEGAITTADARITGRFTQQEANDLALVLRSGALPASLTMLQQEEVGPTLGEDSVKAGVYASIMGLVFVSLFMLAYYRLAGFNALLSIVMNLIILMGFMAYLGAVMTLPGIAGFVLTIGMGVDSNVLIFERIREELGNGKGARQALSAGFDRVFITIVDTHVSSLISAAFLFQFGTGPIRGFATTLFFGLIANVFTAVFVSRTLFELILSRKPAATAKLSI